MEQIRCTASRKLRERNNVQCGPTRSEPPATSEIREVPVLSIEVPVDVEKLLLEVGGNQKDGDTTIRHHHRCEEVEERLPVPDSDGSEDASDALGFVECPGLHGEEVLAAHSAELRGALTLDRPSPEASLKGRRDSLKVALTRAFPSRQGQNASEIARVSDRVALEVSAPRSGRGRGRTGGPRVRLGIPLRGARVFEEEAHSISVCRRSSSASASAHGA